MKGKTQHPSRLFAPALLWGSLWGLVEATFGYLLHALGLFGAAGFVMFPVGYGAMSRAGRETRNVLAVVVTSWVAASVKLVDLFVPGANVPAVINPAKAILLQGLAVAMLRMTLGTVRKPSFGSLALASFGWRLAFVGLGAIGAVGLAGGFRFLLVDSLANAALIFVCLLIGPALALERDPSPILRRPLVPALAYVAATAAQFFL